MPAKLFVLCGIYMYIYINYVHVYIYILQQYSKCCHSITAIDHIRIYIYIYTVYVRIYREMVL